MNKNKISNVIKTLDKKYVEKILNKDETFEGKKIIFEKYQKLIINSINQTAGGTKPRVVGQMSEIVPIFRDYCIENEIKISPENWKNWYIHNYPNNYDKAFKKIKKMVENFKIATNDISNDQINKWMNNFLFKENIEGLLVQYKIMNFIKKEFPNFNVRPATSKEESKNIDIVINNINYQVKPLSMKLGTSFQQKWGNEIAIWYKKGIKNKKLIYKIFLPKELYKK